MSTFGVYFLVLTICLMLYYAGVILWDLFKTKPGSGDEVEEIVIDDDDEESPRDVIVTDDGFRFGDEAADQQPSGGDVKPEDVKPEDNGPGNPDNESDIPDSSDDETMFNDDSGIDISDEMVERLRSVMEKSLEAVDPEYQTVYDSTEFHIALAAPSNVRTKVERHFETISG